MSESVVLNDETTPVEVGPNFEWRRKPRSGLRILSDAFARLRATWRSAGLTLLLLYILPFFGIVGLVAMIDGDLGSELLTSVLSRLYLTLSLIVSICMNDLAWGRHSVPVKPANLLKVVRPFIVRVLMFELLNDLFWKFFLDSGIPFYAHNKSIEFILIIAVILVGARILYTPFVIQFEDLDFIVSLRRSWQLTSKRLQAKAFNLIVFAAIASALVLLVIFLSFGIGVSLIDPTFLEEARSAIPVPTSWFILQVIEIVAIGTSSVILQYVLVEAYVDLRVRRGEWTAPPEPAPASEQLPSPEFVSSPIVR